MGDSASSPTPKHRRSPPGNSERLSITIHWLALNQTDSGVRPTPATLAPPIPATLAPAATAVVVAGGAAGGAGGGGRRSARAVGSDDGTGGGRAAVGCLATVQRSRLLHWGHLLRDRPVRTLS